MLYIDCFIYVLRQNIIFLLDCQKEGYNFLNYEIKVVDNVSFHTASESFAFYDSSMLSAME